MANDIMREEHGHGINVAEHTSERDSHPGELRIVSHSQLMYWWPVWAIGFIFAAITWFFGEPVDIGKNAPPEQIHASNSLGIIFTGVLLAVLIVTNISLRGMAAGLAILGALFVTVLFALFGWWDDIFRIMPEFTVHMNFGFYMFVSTVLFIVWALTVFVFDQMRYWRIEAGQVTHQRLIGGGEESFDTRGLVFEEKRDDPFRHWLLGFGSGDLKMTIPGASSKEVELPNVVFANAKVTKAQQLIKRKPD